MSKYQNAPCPSQTKLIHLVGNPKTGTVQWHYLRKHVNKATDKDSISHKMTQMVWRCSREYNMPTTDKNDLPNEQCINRGRAVPWHKVEVAWCQHSPRWGLDSPQPRNRTLPDALRVQLFAQWDSVSLIPSTPREKSMTDKVTWHRRSGVSTQKSPRIGLTSRLASHRHSGSAVVDCTTWLCLICPLHEQIPKCTPPITDKIDPPFKQSKDWSSDTIAENEKACQHSYRQGFNIPRGDSDGLAVQ